MQKFFLYPAAFTLILTVFSPKHKINRLHSILISTKLKFPQNLLKCLLKLFSLQDKCPYYRSRSKDWSHLKASNTNKMTENRLTELLRQDWSFYWDRLCRSGVVLKYLPVGGLRGPHKPKLSAAWQNGWVKWILCPDAADLEELPWRWKTVARHSWGSPAPDQRLPVYPCWKLLQITLWLITCYLEMH